MKTLIIPDTHERIEALQALKEQIRTADRVVHLGDWADSFRDFDDQRVIRVCQLINATAHDSKWTNLLGNHDCHYFFTHPMFLCSGYDPRKCEIIQRLVKPDTISLFKLFTRVGPYLVSHAGFCEATLQWAKPEVEQEVIQVALDGGFDPIFGAGRARGGAQMWGGPTWLDWNEEFIHMDGVPQIVGHTNGKGIRMKGGHAEHKSYCIDAASNWVVWVDEETGEVTPEELGRYDR